MTRDILTETEKAIINRPNSTSIRFCIGVLDKTIHCLPLNSLPPDFFVVATLSETDISSGLTVAQWNRIETKLRTFLKEQ